MIIVPEILFTHRSPAGFNLARNIPMPTLRINHHRAEPMNTPKTNTLAET
jgi:hypothetical protein